MRRFIIISTIIKIFGHGTNVKSEGNIIIGDNY